MTKLEYCTQIIIIIIFFLSSQLQISWTLLQLHGGSDASGHLLQINHPQYIYIYAN